MQTSNHHSLRMTIFRNLCRISLALLGSVLFPACVLAGAVSTAPVVLHLKNGDQITGLIVSEKNNQVTVSNAWVKALVVPLSEISNRETNKITKASRPAHPVAEKKPSAPRTNVVAAAKSSIKAPAKSKGTWHGQINVGLDAVMGSTDQRSYSGRVQLTYLQPYKADPKKFLRNTSTLSGEYQKTDGVESANRASGKNKSDFDLWRRYYAYALEGVGYDNIQKINFQYQVGPGGGMHVIQHKKFVLNTEAGLSYEAQYRQSDSDLRTFYARLAEDVTWILQKNLKLTENLAFYPDLENFGQYRNEFTTTLSYGFWENLSLDLSAIDRYNTELTPGVERNQFELRSSLGFKF